MARFDKNAVRAASRLEDVIPALTGHPLSRNGTRELTARCAWHGDGDDQHPSLRIDVEKQQWFCDVCRDGGDVFKYVMRHQQTDFKGAVAWCAQRAGLAPDPPSRIVATFDYRALDGQLLYQSCRKEPGPNGKKKTFIQRRPDGQGGWIYDTKGVELVPYRFPDIQGQEAVFISEGEGKADRLWDLRLPATCNVGGAGKWKAEYATRLEAVGVRRVAILGDNDPPGREHVEQVARSCHAAGLGVRIVELPDLPTKGDVINWLDAGHTRDELVKLARETGEWTPPPPPAEPTTTTVSELVPTVVMRPLADLLHALEQLIRTYVVITEDQATAAAVWVVHTHAIAATDHTPYLQITSATKRAGKTRLLEVLEQLVARPWFTGRTSAAALVRKVDAEQPTLLLDESDAAFKGEKEYAEALRGILNTGYHRSGRVTLCVGQGANLTFKDFSTFGPKAIAGIGTLPDTIADRAITIALQRKTTSEPCARWRERQGRTEAAPLRQVCTAWATAPTIATLRSAQPMLPPSLGDRQADIWEPLLAIADMAGGPWPDRTRTAAIALTGSIEDQDVAVELLRDLCPILDASTADFIPTKDLLAKLLEFEDSRWPTWRNGGPLTPRGLARLLGPLGIHPMQVGRGRGYRRNAFTDVIARYLPSQVCKRDEPNKTGPELAFSKWDDNVPIPHVKTAKSPMNTDMNPACTHANGGNGDRAQFAHENDPVPGPAATAGDGGLILRSEAAHAPVKEPPVAPAGDEVYDL